MSDPLVEPLRIRCSPLLVLGVPVWLILAPVALVVGVDGLDSAWDRLWLLGMILLGFMVTTMWRTHSVDVYPDRLHLRSPSQSQAYRFDEFEVRPFRRGSALWVHGDDNPVNLPVPVKVDVLRAAMDQARGVRAPQEGGTSFWRLTGDYRYGTVEGWMRARMPSWPLASSRMPTDLARSHNSDPMITRRGL